MAWNDERVDLLKKLWADGLSASQIAGRLGGVTRNAVIGKVHRLGLSGRATTSRMKSHRPRARAQTAKRLMKPRFANIGNSGAAPALSGRHRALHAAGRGARDPACNERKYIQTLTEVCCRWPIGDPQHADFHFCGKKKVTGLPYCELHARRAFQPPQPRRRDREVFEPPCRWSPRAARAGSPREPAAEPQQDKEKLIALRGEALCQ